MFQYFNDANEAVGWSPHFRNIIQFTCLAKYFSLEITFISIIIIRIVASSSAAVVLEGLGGGLCSTNGRSCWSRRALFWLCILVCVFVESGKNNTQQKKKTCCKDYREDNAFLDTVKTVFLVLLKCRLYRQQCNCNFFIHSSHI